MHVAWEYLFTIFIMVIFPLHFPHPEGDFPHMQPLHEPCHPSPYGGDMQISYIHKAVQRRRQALE